MKRYLDYLSKTHLIKISQNYSKQAAKRTKRVKKIYTHPSIAIQISREVMEKLDNASISRYVECLFSEEYTWRDHGNEIPIVWSDTSPLPVDIDYGDVLEIDRIKNILRFMEGFDSEVGLILTKEGIGKLDLGGKSDSRHTGMAYLYYIIKLV